MTSNNIPEEFPKKQKEDKICPIANQCPELYSCEHAKPHIANDECILGEHSCKPCIIIPDKWRETRQTGGQKEMTTCPHIGESGGCDDCKLNLDPMSCEEELRDYEANTS